MNPTMVVLPEGFSIADKELRSRIDRVTRRVPLEALLEALHIGADRWAAVNQGRIVETELLQQVTKLLEQFGERQVGR